MKQLFLSHYSQHAAEIRILARELRFRGIRPWVDKQGGFLIADESVAAAERAICADCFGLLLYATDDVFGRSFIREHEIPAALSMKADDDRFLLVAVPRGIGFTCLRTLSESAFGVDLSQYHTRQVSGETECIGPVLGAIAADILEKALLNSDFDSKDGLTVQFSTRELAPVEPIEVLTIDGTGAYADSAPSDLFNALTRGLRDAKRAISTRFGRPKLSVHGFKHLSAAFLFGRVFQPFDITVKQTPKESWSLVRAPTSGSVMCVDSTQCDGATDLVVQVSSRFKELTPSVDKAMACLAFNRLVLRPAQPPLDVDEGTCATMIRDCYAAIEREVSLRPVSRIHLFAAAPQAVMMGLGARFAGMPTSLAYDFDGSDYMAPRTIPGGVL